jgi:hypothetical protein
MSNLNYKHFTYKWQNQPYIITKNNKNQIVPSNARPITNGSWLINQPGGNQAKDGNAFLARPLKQWRKQLQPNLIRSGTQSKNIIPLDLPGSVITLGSGLPKNTTPNCCGNGSETICKIESVCKNYVSIDTKIVSDISKEKYNNLCNGTGNCSALITQDDVINKCWNGPIGKRICCNPESNLIKGSQTTPINNNFTDTSAYLQRRCKKYYQRLSSQHAKGVEYYTSKPTYYSDLSGVALYPIDSPTGPQVTQKTSCSGNCGSTCEKCNKSCPTGYLTQINQDTIYKPSNRSFSIDGGVKGSARILKLKNDSFYQNGAQTNNANGLKATNYGYYNAEGNGSYFIKIKPTAPQCFSKPYDHTRCFFTPSGNIAGPRGKVKRLH